MKLPAVIAAVRAQYRLDWDGLHGSAHWERVRENGLRLAANETGYVPKTFTLMPDGATQGQMCQVTWRSPTDIGVAVIADAQRSKKGNNHGNRRKQQMAERYPV